MSTEERAEEASRSVSTLELFFDLVFVFAITQLTALLADDPTPRGAFQVLLIALLALLLAVIVIHPRRGIVRPLTDGHRVPSTDEVRDTS